MVEAEQQDGNQQLMDELRKLEQSARQYQQEVRIKLAIFADAKCKLLSGFYDALSLQCWSVTDS